MDKSYDTGMRYKEWRKVILESKAVTYADVLAATKKGAERAPFKTQGVDVMREIVRQRIRTSALSLAEQVLQELEEVEGVIAGAEA